MQFENVFTVDADVADVYAALLDIERVAPCLPGAQVLEKVDDTAFKVAVKVRVGPVAMQYRSDVTVVESDPEAHRAVLAVKARETRGQGTANATATMQLQPTDTGTEVALSTDVALTGKAAAMGQGVIASVSEKLVGQFAANLAAMVEGREETPPPAAPAGGAAAPAPGAASASTPPPAAAEPAALDAGGIVAELAAARLRDPKLLVGLAVAVLALLGLWRATRSG